MAKKNVKWKHLTNKDKLYLASLIGGGSGLVFGFAGGLPLTFETIRQMGLVSVPAFAGGGALVGVSLQGAYEIAKKFKNKLTRWMKEEGHRYERKLSKVI